jgi:hypothetical protein
MSHRSCRCRVHFNAVLPFSLLMGRLGEHVDKGEDLGEKFYFHSLFILA